MTVCRNIETACESLGNIKIPNRDGLRTGTTQSVLYKIRGDTDGFSQKGPLIQMAMP